MVEKNKKIKIGYIIDEENYRYDVVIDISLKINYSKNKLTTNLDKIDKYYTLSMVGYVGNSFNG